ncbi:MAG TPA: hypothetical protein DC049_10970 [Spirochaetia bacterium]|nr:hypothetical protein [Spirochaetia bacterium]
MQSVSGNVKIISGQNSRTAAKGMELSGSDYIKTFINSQAVLVSSTGEIKTILAEKSQLVSALFGTKNQNDLMSIFMKIRKADEKIVAAPVVIAGVRGSEQGKKAGFGVMWQQEENPASTSAASDEAGFEKAVTLMKNRDYINAAAEFDAYIKNPSAKNKEKAYIYSILAYVELLDYKTALEKTENALASAGKNPDVETLRFYKALCHVFLDNKTALKSLTEYFDGQSVQAPHYWDAKALHLYYLAAHSQKEEARRIRDDIQLNCNDVEIKEKALSVPL